MIGLLYEKMFINWSARFAKKWISSGNTPIVPSHNSFSDSGNPNENNNDDDYNENDCNKNNGNSDKNDNDNDDNNDTSRSIASVSNRTNIDQKISAIKSKRKCFE